MTARRETSPLRIGLAGLGTVGCGVIRLLNEHRETITNRAGRPIDVVGVSARSRDKDRGLDLSAFRWHEDAHGLAGDSDIDVVLELIGGAEGTAHTLTQAALRHGKPVVTANKALIALHGEALNRLAQERNVPLLFEAAVAGGIPSIKIVREGLAGDVLHSVGGILNGTCNYILTEMQNTGRDFEDVLREAQEKGYAEAEPSTDIDGWDTAHKLAILAGIAFRPVRFDSLTVEGIRSITAADLKFSDELGYRIKLLGMARRHAHDSVEGWVRPCLIPKGAPLAGIDGVFNAVATQGPYSGPVTISGRGAGEGPTASAVVADLIDLARGAHIPLWGVHEAMPPLSCTALDMIRSAFYLRLTVDDRPGVMADMSSILRDQDVSVHFVSQHDVAGEQASLTVITHPTEEHHVRTAAARLGALPRVHGTPLVLKIETVQ